MYPQIRRSKNTNIEGYDCIQISRKKTIKDLLEKMHRIYKQHHDKLEDRIERRIWKIDPLCDFKEIAGRISFDRPNQIQGNVLVESSIIEVIHKSMYSSLFYY